MSHDPKRKLEVGRAYGLYKFDTWTTCKKCGVARLVNRVGHCEACQDELDKKAGVAPRK